MRPYQTTYIRSLIFALSLLLSACSGSTTPTVEVAEEAPSDAMTETMPEMSNNEMPADLDIATDRMTDQGLFHARISSNLDPVDINQLHSWTLHLETPDGQPIEAAEIVIDGGMPQHNHGFPTTPQITENLGGGDYLVEGVRFNMTGWWEMKFDITADGQSDHITFNLVVETGHAGDAMADLDHSAHSDEMPADELMVQNIVGNLTLPTPTGAIYMTIMNGTAHNETLTGAQVAGCEVIEFHESKMVDDVMKMQPVEGGEILIPAGETVTLKPGGLHLMCIGKSQTFAAGDHVPVTLIFANTGEIEQMAEVRPPDQLEMDHADHDTQAHDKIPNDGAVINIVSPADGAEISTGEMITIQVETEGFDLTAAGNHWHVYVDGELVEMIEDGRSETMLHDLEPGEHTIMTTMTNADHVELEDGAMINVTVK